MPKHKDMKHGEIVVYKTAQDAGLKLEVRVEDDTVWLTQSQMAELFQTTRNNVTLHVGNVFKEGELKKSSVCKESLLTALDGKKYKTLLYNLDVIISIGYRVKSLRGTQFRVWANRILKDYLLKGHVINHRLARVENEVSAIKDKVAEIEIQINSDLPATEGIFYDGQIFDAWEFVSKLVKSARHSITLIDNYIDESVLGLLAKRAPRVKATIYTAKTDQRLKLDLQRHNKQYAPIQIHTFSRAHDRFLIIDEEAVYHIGASLKDLGKKWFAFSRMQMDAKEMIERLKE